MNQVLERFRISFHLVCQVSAFSLIAYWIYLYTLNKDLCTIDYKTFHDDTEDQYPILSLCFSEKSSDKLFSFTDHSVSQSIYTDFLEGKYFDSSLLNIDYDNNSIDMSDYIVGQWGKYSNGSSILNNVDAYQPIETFMKSSLWYIDHNSFYNCYPLKVPQTRGLEY